MMNYYELLGISRYASSAEIEAAVNERAELIKTAYRVLTNDEEREQYQQNGDIDYYALFGTNPSASSARLKELAQNELNYLQDVYLTLSDEQKRKVYDNSLQQDTELKSKSPEVVATDLFAAPNVIDDDPYSEPMSRVGLDMAAPELATRLERLQAYMLDLSIYFVPMLIILQQFDISESGELSKTGSETIMSIGLFLILFIFIINVSLLYKNGQTIGKKIIGIKIVMFDYERASLSRLLILRYFLIGLISSVPVIGPIIGLINILMIFGEERRCLHDYMAGTIVVKMIKND